jgi:hypothetical protein
VPDVGASVTGQPSESLAKAAALNACESKGGGGDCAVEFTYFNQCVAVAYKEGVGIGISSEGTLEKAEESSLKRCSSNYGEGCSIVMAECSKPIYHRD